MTNSKKNKIIKGITISLWIIFSLFIIYYIISGCKSFIDYDASFITDYRLEQIRTHSIFPVGWYETNDFWIYFIIPIVNIFIRLGINLFSSRQLAVLIQSIAIFIFLYNVFYDKKNKYSFWIPGLLLISGISGQMTYELFGDGAYGAIILWILIILLNVQHYFEKPKLKNLLVIGISLGLLIMFSVRFIIYITAPLLILLVVFYLENGLKKEYINLAITLIISFIIGYILHIILSNCLLYITSYGSGIITSREMLEFNINNFLYNLFFLTGSSNTNIEFGFWNYNHLMFNYKVDSVTTAFQFIRYVYAISLFVIPFILKRKYKEFSIRDKIIYLYTVSVLILITFFIFICGMSDWFKYLIPIVFLLTSLYILFYRYYIKKVRQKIVFSILVGIFIIYSLFLNISTVYSFDKHEFRKNYYQGLTDFLVEHDLTFGYEYSNLGKNAYTLLSNGRVRVEWIENYDAKGPVVKLWLNSKDWFDRTKHQGKIFFMRAVNDNPIECEDLADEVYYYELESERVLKIFVFEDSNVLYDIINMKKIEEMEK